MSTTLFNTIVAFAAAAVTFVATDFNYGAAAAVFSLASLALTVLNPGTPSANLNDIRATKSAYGEFIAIPYNNVRLGANLVWASTVRAKKRGHGGYEYGQDLLYEICETTILGQHVTPTVQRIWLNHQLVYDIRPGAQLSNIVGLISGSNGVQVFKFYDGAPDQVPIPLLVENDGSGKVPAYRGVFTILCQNCPLHLYGNAVPSLEVELVVTTVLPNDTNYELFLDEHIRGASSLQPGTIIYVGKENLFPDWVNNKVYSGPRSGLNPAPQTSWYVCHDLMGNLISKVPVTQLLTLSGDNEIYPPNGTQIDQYVLCESYVRGVAGSHYSKLDLATGQQVAYMTPNANVTSTGQTIQVHFQIGGTNYVAMLMDEPSGSPNIEIINVDTMTSAGTGDVTYTGFYGNILIAGTNPDPDSIDLFFFHGAAASDYIGLEKINWSRTSGFTITHIANILPTTFEAGWGFLYNPDVGCWDPTDNTLIVVVEGEYSTFTDIYSQYHCVLAKINPATGALIWKYRMEGQPNGSDFFHNAFVRTIISGGVLLISDYYKILEIDTSDGSVITTHWVGYTDLSCGCCIGDMTQRRIALVYGGSSEKQYGAIAYTAAAPKLLMELPLGGATSFGHWQDPQAPYAYVLRERWDFAGMELAKIDISTGEVVASYFENYSVTYVPAYKALSANCTSVIGSYAGTKLYVWTQQNLGGGLYGVGLIEFDKATLARTNFWDFGSSTVGSVSAFFDNDGGGQCMDENGNFLVRILGFDTTGVSPNLLPSAAYIALVDTSLGTVSRIDLHTKGWGTGSKYRPSRGCFFDVLGQLHILAIPCANGSDTRQASAGVVFRHTVAGGLAPDVSVGTPYILAADNTIFYPQPVGSFAVFRGASYNIADNVAYIFKDNDNQQPYTAAKPVIKWNVALPEQSEHVVDDFPGNQYGSAWPEEKNGWSAVSSGSKYVNFWTDSTGPNDVSSKFIVLDVSNKSLTEYNIAANWYQIGDLLQGTSFHTLYVGATKTTILSIPSNGSGNDTYNSERVATYNIYPPETNRVSLETICKDISERTGTLVDADIDYSTLANTYPTGFSVNSRQTARSDIEGLQIGFLFDIIESDWKLKAVFRQDGVVATTIPEDDVVAQNETDRAFNFRDANSKELARWIDLSYFDYNRDYQVNIASARIGGGTQDDRNAQKISTPTVMTASEAVNTAIRIIEAGWSEAMTTKFQLPYKYLAYEPSDVVLLTRGILEFEVRLTTQGIGANWALDVEASKHDSGAYQAIGIPNSNNEFGTPAGGGGSSTSLNVVSPPIMLVMDTALLDEADDSPGMYLTAIPQFSFNVDGAQWFGADFERSLTSDFAVPNTVGSISLAPVSGVCQNALGNITRWEGWDRTNTLTIKLTSGTLTNLTDETDVWNFGTNLALIGNELIAFANCEQLQLGTWRLYNLLRGLKGTEQFISTHDANESFFLIDSTKYTNYTYGNSEIGQTRYYRASNDSPNQYSLTVTSPQTTRRLMPYAPYYFSASRDGSNNLTVSFLRRSRFVATSLLNDSPLGETSAVFEADIYSGTTIVRTITSTASAGGSVIDPSLMTVYYSAADQVTDFGSTQSSVHMKIYQKNATVGRGYPGDTTL